MKLGTGNNDNMRAYKKIKRNSIKLSMLFIQGVYILVKFLKPLPVLEL